jgi:hypothetical protein
MGLLRVIRPLFLMLALSAGGGVAWAAADSGDAPWIGTRLEPALLPPGEIVVVEVMLQTDAPPLGDLTLRAIITDPQGIERVIDLPPTDVDHFASAFRGTGQVGEHRVQVIAVGVLADGTRVEINPQAAVFEVNEDAPPTPQLPPEVSPSLPGSPDTDSLSEITQASTASGEAVAAGRQVMSYPPWAPYAIGGAALLLLLGGAAVIVRGRKRKTAAAASKPKPDSAASEDAPEALPAAEPAPRQEGAIPSLDPVEIGAVEESEDQEGKEEEAEPRAAAEEEREEAPSDAEVSGAHEGTPEEKSPPDESSTAAAEDGSASPPETIGAVDSEAPADKDKIESAPAEAEANSESGAPPAVAPDAQAAAPEEDMSNEQLASLWESALEESGDKDKGESAPAELEANSESEAKPAAAPDAQEAAPEADMSDEQLASLWESALEESGDKDKIESAEGSGEPGEQQESSEAANAERISQEELRALYDRAASQVGGDKPSAGGESGG